MRKGEFREHVDEFKTEHSIQNYHHNLHFPYMPVHILGRRTCRRLHYLESNIQHTCPLKLEAQRLYADRWLLMS